MAGLTAAIHLAINGISVKVLEKESYPRHKVCGEYVSKEILPYFKELGLSLEELCPVEISCLKYSTARGSSLEVNLPMGGLGLSRYAFDSFLFQKALETGVNVVQETTKSVESLENGFLVETLRGRKISTKIVLGSFGKRSNLDKSLNRSFIQRRSPWVAVKSHYLCENFKNNQVGLHNFEGGYCGLSKTETGAVNVCYLANLNSFKKYKDPKKYEKQVLRKNPFLERFFNEAEPIFEKPLSIAQVSFRSKSLVENHMLLLGDAAGLLHPLCGNGMAMAIHSAKIASELVLQRFSTGMNQKQLEQEYIRKWKSSFQNRLRVGEWLQKIVVNQRLSEVSLSVASFFPGLFEQIIRKTHGNPIL